MKTNMPTATAIKPSIINSHRHGSLPVASNVKLLPMEYEMRPLKAPEKVAAE